MKRILTIIALALAASLMWGCFKDVVDYTFYNIAIYEQTSTDDPFTRATDVETYAFSVDTTEWSVLSYDDAVAGRITNKTTGEVLSTPDVAGTFDAQLPYPVSMRLEQPISMLVVVNPTLRLYAYRKYELPENLPSVDTKLYMASWRATHSSSGWLVKNDFYSAPNANK